MILKRHVEKCPVCDGAGKLAPQLDRETTAPSVEPPCHGCGGKGWVVVDDTAPLRQPIYDPPVCGFPYASARWHLQGPRRYMKDGIHA
jgi:hypothetical protein